MKKPFYLNAFYQVTFAIVAGIILGYGDPAAALRMKPLGELFIQAIRFLVGPIIFCTVSVGIATMGDLRKLGSLGLKTGFYFEMMAALALLAGLLGAWIFQPGAGFQLDLAADARPVALLLPGAQTGSLLQILQSAFLHNGILQIVLCALAFGVLLAKAGARGQFLMHLCQRISDAIFRIVNLVLKLAPIAAFGAIAYTVGRHGLVSVAPLLKLLATLYLVTMIFVAVFLGVIARMAGFRLWQFIVYIREELTLVFGTASSFSAMPRLMEKLRLAGCTESVIGLVVPAGYSFNLSGSNIYLSLAIVFLAQASQIELTFAHYVAIFAVGMITSKGSSGVAGSAFIVLAATLAAVPAIPTSSLVFIFSIERLLKCRSLANLIANGVACIALSAWTKQLDSTQLARLKRLPD
jgi:aerobic C4-dicarboxylate transport protein